MDVYELPLIGGDVALIDATDRPLIESQNSPWRVGDGGYVMSGLVRLHRLLLDFPPCEIDHKSDWHTCETTHCRAGWVVQLAGEAGATLIYRASDPDLGPLPDFYCDNETAMRDIKRRAEMEATAV